MTIDPTRLASMANAIRALAMDAVQAANSGHPGMPMGMADVATVLWTRYLRHDPADPKWPDRDRFVLSAGHGSMLLYALLHLTGYERPTMDDIRNFRQLGSPCAGHPENFELAGVECTTGPLGQGLAMAVGMAIAERHLNATFGADLVDHRTWVVAGDGCLMEGINHEAIGLAGHLKLGGLNVLWDDNRITIDGPTSLSTSEDIPARYRASGWHVVACDGHDFADIARAIDEALADPRPSLIACHTIIGRGAPNKQGSHDVHGAPLGADEIAAARVVLGWTAPPFEIPADIAATWRMAGELGQGARAAWRERLAASDKAGAFTAQMAGELPPLTGFAEYLAKIAADQPTVATRKASENALQALTADVPAMIGGSADLTGSNNTKTSSTKPLTAEDYSGRYLYYGIREFGMAAAMNGMALHGGVIPYGGTFLVFSDYCRNAIRMSALQRARVVYVMTHDSIGLGEDGPTHQSVEHAASLRLIPNLDVWRPADTAETAVAWAVALQNTTKPTALLLSRQNISYAPKGSSDLAPQAYGLDAISKGAYVLAEPGEVGLRKKTQAVIIATGSEVQLALKAQALLAARKIAVRVVSMPSTTTFDRQSAAYKSAVLPAGLPRIAVEMGVSDGWWKYGCAAVVGIDTFGESAPAPALFKYFGFTPENVADTVQKVLGKR